VCRQQREIISRKNYIIQHFGRITGIAVSKENNVLLCDYIKNQLLMFDEEGNYLSYLPLIGSPWDVAISNQNIAYVHTSFPLKYILNKYYDAFPLTLPTTHMTY
jgi:hypothetical protein